MMAVKVSQTKTTPDSFSTMRLRLDFCLTSRTSRWNNFIAKESNHNCFLFSLNYNNIYYLNMDTLI